MFSLDIARLAVRGRSEWTKEVGRRSLASRAPQRSSSGIKKCIIDGKKSDGLFGKVGLLKVPRSGMQNAIEMNRIVNRRYTTPAPVEEAAKPVVDSFVSSAVEMPPVVVEKVAMVGSNEGFARLFDPVSWTGLTDPIYWFVQGSMEAVHAATGLPWWASLVVFALGLRCVSFPLQVMQFKQSAIMQAIQPELQEVRKKYMYAGAGAKGEWNRTAAQDMSNESRAIMAKHGVGLTTSLKYTVPQAFLTVSAFLVTRSLANNPTSFVGAQWSEGGAFWFQNLCAVDPTYLLPIISATTTSALLTVMPIPNLSRKTVYAIAGGLGAISFFFTWHFPAAVHMFWAGSSIFTMFFTILLRQPAIRALVRLPPLDPIAAAAAAPKPLLFDAPPSHRPKVERVAIKPDANTSANKKKSTRN